MRLGATLQGVGRKAEGVISVGEVRSGGDDSGGDSDSDAGRGRGMRTLSTVCGTGRSGCIARSVPVAESGC